MDPEQVRDIVKGEYRQVFVPSRSSDSGLKEPHGAQLVNVNHI